jgi:hypothetical protein
VFEVSAERLAANHFADLGSEQSGCRSSGSCSEDSWRTRRAAHGTGDGLEAFRSDLTGAAMRAIGAWPSTQVALERLVSALEAAAADTEDTEA